MSSTKCQPSCDLLQLIGLDMQYVRWKPSNSCSNNQTRQNNNHHSNNNHQTHNRFQRNIGYRQTSLTESSNNLSQSNPNLDKWNNNNNNSCPTSSRNHPTNHRRRDSSPWPLMGDDSAEKSVSSTATCAIPAPPSSAGTATHNHSQSTVTSTCVKPPTSQATEKHKKGCTTITNSSAQYQMNNYQQYSQDEYQGFHQHNHQGYRRNSYNYSNFYGQQYQHHQQHHPGNNMGGRRNHQTRYYNHFVNGNNGFNGNGFMPNNNLNGGGQKRYQNGRHHQSHVAARGRRAANIFVQEPSAFPLVNDPRFIELINAGTPPDKFLNKAKLVQITKPPQQLTNGSPWDELSKAVWSKFLTNQQTEETYTKKLTLWKCLYVYLKIVYPRYTLFMVGSTMSGFGSNTSDVDMCLMVRPSPHSSTDLDHRCEALYHLRHLMDHFSSNVSGIFHNIELIHAKVPLLKFKYRNEGLDIDMCCNNTVGVRNTHLLYCYAKLDWRVRPLVLVVKLWAQWHDINDAKNTTISSYSLALLVIHFLQCGCSPPVLPCLQQTNPSSFAPQLDVTSIDFHADLSPPARLGAPNNQPIGQLLVEFFNYYNQFDYRQYAISVRQGCCLFIDECRNVRTSKNEPHQWKYLCIEEPFDLTNTARSVNNPESFEKIRNVIQQTALILNATHSLDAIFRLDSMNSWSPHLL